jgi:hypothetical protein
MKFFGTIFDVDMAVLEPGVEREREREREREK